MDDPFTIFVDDAHWLVAKASEGGVDVVLIEADEASVDVDARVSATRRRMEEMGYADQSVVMALPSSWCLSAVIDTDDLERSGRRAAMGFRLEEHLPIASEQVVADYCEMGDEALGVCIDVDRIKPIVDAFESAGVQVRHVSPAAMLASAETVAGGADCDAVLMTDTSEETNGRSERFDVIELEKGRPSRWHWMADREDEVARQLGAGGDEASRKVAVLGAPAVQRFRDLGADLMRLEETDGYRAAAMHATRLLAGTASPWIELRRDRLGVVDRFDVYRKPMAMMWGAVVLLLLSVCAVAQWRGQGYQSEAESARDQQATVYETLYADEGRKAPSGSIRHKLKREAERLAGLSGQGVEGGVESLQPRSALEQYHDLLGALPTDFRYRITSIDIEPDRVTLGGEAKSNAEAERIAKALRDQTAYEVDAPRMTAIADGVSFTFSARYSKQKAAQLGEGGQR